MAVGFLTHAIKLGESDATMIAEESAEESADEGSDAIVRARPTAFLDRDGVINRDHGYVSRWEEFELLPGVEDALRALQAGGYQLVVITNQSGIARGFYSEADFRQLTQQMVDYFATRDITIAGVFYCPHHPVSGVGQYLQNCECRKPAPGLIREACESLPIDLSASLLVGDKGSDIAAGKAAGIRRLYQVMAKTREPDGSGYSEIDDGAFNGVFDGACEPGALAVTSLADVARRPNLGLD